MKPGSGSIRILFANMSGTIQHVSAGRLNVLAVTSHKRSSLMPEVPTVAESGLEGYEATTWFGILAPAGTPREVVAKLNAEIGAILASPDLIEHLRADGAEATGGSPGQFKAFLRAEIDRWAPVVKAAGAKAD